MENKKNDKMTEMSEEKLEGVAGGAYEAGAGEIVMVEMENFEMRPGIVLYTYFSRYHGWECGVELGHYDENGAFVGDGEEVYVNSAQVHPGYSK